MTEDYLSDFFWMSLERSEGEQGSRRFRHKVWDSICNLSRLLRKIFVGKGGDLVT